jgi:hypothetical protein
LLKEDFGLFGVEFRRGSDGSHHRRKSDGPNHPCYPRKEARKVKTTIIALSAAAVIAAAPGVLAQNVSSKTPDKQHHASKKHPRVVSVYAPGRAMHAKGSKTGYPGAWGYTPSEPKDYVYENSRYGGGGGGGGGGSGM